jgi:DNA-binding beta-propeller fold protein YncE
MDDRISVLKAARRDGFKGMMNFISFIFLLSISISSCKKDPDPSPVTNANGERVLVVCEGSLGNGNSALTLFEPDSNRATEDVFKQANGIPLGDVFQSITRIDDRYFLCINNSDRIYVINRSDFKIRGSISIPKPRYILQVSPTKAYVSTIFSNKVYIINPSTLTVRSSIDMPFKNPEGMCLVGNHAFVANWDSACSAIYPIDTATDAIGPAVAVAGKSPQELLLDKEGKMWVMGGNQADGVQATLSQIDPNTGNLLKSYSFGKEDPVHPAFNKTKDTLYFILVKYTPGSTQSGIYRMSINDASLPSNAFVSASGLQNFWGLGIHPKTGAVYVADPLGFTQRGRVSIYNPVGSLLNSFQTGVGPGHFLFD